MSPVQPRSVHVFFGFYPTKPEDRRPLKLTTAANVPDGLQTLKSSKDETYQALKSAVNGINLKDSSEPSPEAGVFERHPSGPKSRIASSTRQAVDQEQELYTHDLAGVAWNYRRNVQPPGTGWEASKLPESLSLDRHSILRAMPWISFQGVTMKAQKVWFPRSIRDWPTAQEYWVVIMVIYDTAEYHLHLMPAFCMLILYR